MKLLILSLLLLLLLPAQAIPYAVTIGNVSVSYEAPLTMDDHNAIQPKFQPTGVNPDSLFYGQPCYVIPLGKTGNAPVLTISPGSLPSLSQVKQLQAQRIEKDGLDLYDGMKLSAGSWQVCGQPGIGDSIIIRGSQDRWYEGIVTVFFQKGPYVCCIDKRIDSMKGSHHNNESDIRQAMVAFNESMSHLKVEVM
jgi:hypothetical protein